MNKRRIRILFKKPNEQPKEMYVADELENYQELLEGYMETVHLNGRVWILCNEEGKFINLEPNIPYGRDILVGNIIFVASDEEGDFTDLTDEEIEKIYEFLD